jgi:diguanylate cyclase (GGDEF)-like protein
MVALAADETSIALQRLTALKRLEALALTDSLTGVPNRRAFDERLPADLAHARRSGRPLAIAMLDLNGLKALNDREGHEAGDRLLCATASAWSADLRDGDMLARLGGDEFAVLLPDCAATEASAVADRLRRAVPHAPGSGVGVVVWDGAETAATLLGRADRALYDDKARHRRVACAA